MSELFDTIELNAQEKAELERLAYEEKMAERKRATKAKRNKATRVMLTRIGFSALTCLALWLAGKLELMNLHLVLCLCATVFCWLCIWIGAYIQFMWCKGGLLEC